MREWADLLPHRGELPIEPTPIHDDVVANLPDGGDQKDENDS